MDSQNRLLKRKKKKKRKEIENFSLTRVSGMKNMRTLVCIFSEDQFCFTGKSKHQHLGFDPKHCLQGSKSWEKWHERREGGYAHNPLLARKRKR